MDNYLNPSNLNIQRCPRCQHELNTIVVHGHEQCIICKSNIFECCSGDTCETDFNLKIGNFMQHGLFHYTENSFCEDVIGEYNASH